MDSGEVKSCPSEAFCECLHLSTSLVSGCFLPIQICKDVSVKLFNLENILTFITELITTFRSEALYDEIYEYFFGGVCVR